MRVMLGMTIGLAALTGLAACSKSDATVRSEVRDLMLLGCRNGPAADRAAITQAGVNVDQFCTCAIDRTLRSLTSEQIRQISRSPNEVPGMEAASAQCMSEMTPGAGAAGNETAGNLAAPAGPEAPVETEEDAGNATE